MRETNIVSLGLHAWNRPKQPKPRESREDALFKSFDDRCFDTIFKDEICLQFLPLDQLLPEPLPGLSCLVNETSRLGNQTAKDFFVFYFPMKVSGVPIHRSWRKSPGHGP